jgi:hypothetical protein
MNSQPKSSRFFRPTLEQLEARLVLTNPPNGYPDHYSVQHDHPAYREQPWRARQ